MPTLPEQAKALAMDAAPQSDARPSNHEFRIGDTGLHGFGIRIGLPPLPFQIVC